MDPSQAAQDIFESFMMRQWFVAAVLVLVIFGGFLIVRWVLKRQDDRDREMLARQDKRDEELKEVVHNYYNALGANTLSNHALAEGVKDVAGELADLRRSIDHMERGQK